MKVVRTFARVDSSIAHLFGFQHLMLATVDLFGTGATTEVLLRTNHHQKMVLGQRLESFGYRHQNFAQKWRQSHQRTQRVFIRLRGCRHSNRLRGRDWKSPTHRGSPAAASRGVTILGDWDNIGQRQTDSGTVELFDTPVAENELLRHPGPLGSTRASLRPCIAQLLFANIFLGIAEGAFNEARNYTLAQTRAWPSSGVDTTEDPYILRHYGEFFVGLQATRLLVNKAAESLQAAWAEHDAVSENMRGRAAIDIATAKVASSRLSLDISTKMFEVMGSRSTSASARSDRFWRNARTQTLHDPVDYKIRELGNWALNRQIPRATFYS